jgi:hypothetical protein
VQTERIDVDGIMYRVTNNIAQRIHPTDEGIRNFWRWFNGFRFGQVAGKNEAGANGRRGYGPDNGAAGWAADEQGRPRVFFQGADAQIEAFASSIKTANKKVG